MRQVSLGVVALLVLSLAARVAQADPVNGPEWRAGVVEAYSTAVYRATFYGNELARVRIIGDGDTDLDVFVLDEFGNVIASDIGPTDICTAVWRPLWTGSFTIRVVNRGNVYNRFTIYID